MPRAAMYCRVSCDQQRHDLQRDELREFARLRGFEVVAEFQDTISGSRDRRPGLDALVEAAKRRRFDTVLVWKLDRLGRSLRHLVVLLEELTRYGVSVVASSQGIDTSGALGRFVANLMAALGEMERELVIERTKAGMQAAKRRGARIGRPVVAVDRVALAQGIRSGFSVSELAKHLGVSWGTAKKAAAAALAKKVSAPTAGVEPILPSAAISEA